jgi:formate dehydrogenase maturation protein FdhE
MTVEVTRSADGLRLARLDLFFMELLRQIPVSADPADSETARERLYPLATKNDAKTNEDWRTYIHPELKEFFQSASDVVREDLETFEQLDDSHENWAFEIPADHFDQWLNVLNQARLALAARFEFDEKEMGQNGPGTIETVRDLSLFQVHFYGFLQECLLQDLAK